MTPQIESLEPPSGGSLGTSASPSALTNELPHLKLRADEPDRPRAGARLQEMLLHPTPGFVIKSSLQSPHPPSRSAPLTKIFINVSFAPEVIDPEGVHPSASTSGSSKAEGGADAERGNGASKAGTVPVCSVGGVEETLDKAGNTSLVVAATFSPQTLTRCKKEKKYKGWLIQIALEKVEQKMGVDLNRNYTEPNIKSKGTLLPRKAVLPVPAGAAAAGTGINVLEGDELLDHSGAAEGAKKVEDVGDVVEEGKFEVAQDGKRFVFSGTLPKNTIVASPKDLKVALSSSSLALKTPQHTLHYSLPQAINPQAALSSPLEYNPSNRSFSFEGVVAV